MGNSNSSLNDKVNQILNETSPAAPTSGVAGVPVVVNTEAPKNAFVNATTDSPTSSAPAPSGPISTSPTSAEQSATSAAPVPPGVNVFSATSPASPRRARQSGEISVFGIAFTGNPKDLNAAVKKALEEASESQQRPQKGGYTYAGEVNSEPQIGGNTGQIYIDPSMFVSESEQVGGTNEFNPEKFFNDMQSGGDGIPVVHRGKKAVKTGLDKTFDTTPDYLSDQDEDNFDLEAEGLEEDSDEEEDTEDVKNKVKVLRAMVARSKGKKSGKTVKGKRRHNKRMTETGGASENSVSEYLDTTSSINTSDVKLISMKRK